MSWRAMAPGDLADVDGIAARVHPNYPEDQSVFAERLRLHPEGCRVLRGTGAGIAGYVLSHPWYLGRPPSLNLLIGSIPPAASTYYIHDLALLPEARGSGSATVIVEELIRHARALGLTSLSLIAVNGSTPFWERQGFAVDETAAADPTGSYGSDANLMILRLA
ncbi:GNAT family N-acetyltransferase [Bradyrhizobium oligotrophicum]|uniref:GNAT family N-acetyltransferase n=1 Tax=Bradyrhizobium oligotrophicum TaxID=44255 RepID=UPI003EBA89B4